MTSIFWLRLPGLRAAGPAILVILAWCCAAGGIAAPVDEVIRVDSTPRMATVAVIRDEQRRYLGATPLADSRVRDGDLIEISLPGYMTQRFLLAGSEATVALEPLRLLAALDLPADVSALDETLHHLIYEEHGLRLRAPPAIHAGVLTVPLGVPAMAPGQLRAGDERRQLERRLGVPRWREVLGLLPDAAGVRGVILQTTVEMTRQERRPHHRRVTETAKVCLPGYTKPARPYCERRIATDCPPDWQNQVKFDSCATQRRSISTRLVTDDAPALTRRGRRAYWLLGPGADGNGVWADGVTVLAVLISDSEGRPLVVEGDTSVFFAREASR